MVYEIFEGNMDRLEKKLKRIEAKCSKYRCEFHYQKIGETYETVHDLNGELATGRFGRLRLSTPSRNGIIPQSQCVSIVDPTVVARTRILFAIP